MIRRKLKNLKKKKLLKKLNASFFVTKSFYKIKLHKIYTSAIIKMRGGKMNLSFNQKRISICLKLVVIISAIVGTVLSAIQSSEAFMGGNTVFMYFTIQSNLLIALVCLLGLILLFINGKSGRTWYKIGRASCRERV